MPRLVTPLRTLHTIVVSIEDRLCKCKIKLSLAYAAFNGAIITYESIEGAGCFRLTAANLRHDKVMTFID